MKRILLSLGAGAAVLMALIASPISAQMYFMENSKIGQSVPEFTLKSLSGEEKSYVSYRDGKKSIIFFWATWCPHCRKALTQLNQEKDKYLSQDVRIVVIDIGEDLSTVKKYIDTNKVSLDVFLDQDSVLADQFEIIGVPTFFFVDESGKIKDVQHALPEDLKQVFG